MKKKEVFHCSSTQGLRKIIPNKSTHKKSWIYATTEISISAAFLGVTGGDFTCAIGRDLTTGKPFICERFKGAINIRYNNVKGSIYVLPGDTFKENQTEWEEELISTVEVEPIHEIKIDDAKRYIIGLEKENKLIIKYFPNKIANIPNDDEDIVIKAVIWSKKFGKKAILKQVKEYHFNLLDRILKEIKDN